jgi:glutamate N-acetyltransferase / amino-acid N-acetyltransferase
VRIKMGRPRIHVPGFRFAGVSCGLKESGRRDVALIVSDRPAVAVGAFTTNRVKAAPVVVGQERLQRGLLQAIVVNSGNANAYTGHQGEKVARESTALVAKLLGIDERLVVPSSTGRIGVQLPKSQLQSGIRDACGSLSPHRFHEALEGIMTTDAFPKFAVERLTANGRPIMVAGMAKGAGMIAPHMATMLAYVLTDASVSRTALSRILTAALPVSFNCIVVDGDMSTNDTVLLLANGEAGNRQITPRSPGFEDLTRAFTVVMRTLARYMVTDGEGATKVIDVVVRGARTRGDAELAADAVARSPLCKAAFFGGDPYAGRVVCALGYSGARFDPARIDVSVGTVPIVRSGVEVTSRFERRAEAVVAAREFTLTVDLHAGDAGAQRMASDLTPDYVHFNSSYRT